jgi:hypothetical protein
VKHMFHNLDPSLSSYLFSFTSSHLNESWSVCDEDHFIFFDLGLNRPPS